MADDTTVDLVVVGSMSADRLRTPGSPEVMTAGGAGLYASLGAAVAGARVGLVGLASDDVDPALTNELRRRVDAAGLVQIPGRRLRFDIAYDASWHARYIVDGAEDEKLIDFAWMRESYLEALGFHLCPTGPPDTQLAMAQALRADSRTAGARLTATLFRNRITAQPRTAHRLWSLVDMLVCNAAEALLLTGQDSLTAALRHVADRLRDRGGHGTVCVTNGTHGGFVVTAGSTLSVAAYPARVVDPTGAGETFAGALAAVCLSGIDLTHAAAIGMAAASLAVEGFGPAALFAADPSEVRRRAAVLEATIRAGARDE